MLNFPLTGGGGTVPRKMALMMTLKKGSMAFTVCVNDTATCFSKGSILDESSE
jgi:hypothetical protein